MLPTGYKAPPMERREYPPLEKGIYPAELLDIELKKEKAFDSEEMVDKLNFTWVILKEGDTYGRRVWFKATPTLGKKSKLKPVMDSLLGKPLTEEQCKHPEETLSADMLNSLVGMHKALFLDIHTSQTGRQSNIINGYLNLENDLPAFDAEKMKRD